MPPFTESYITQIKDYLSAEPDGVLPAFVDIGMTDACNLHCIMCRKPGQNGQTMPMSTFRKTVGETCPAALCYNLQHAGESLLLPDFRERLEYLSARKRNETIVELFTNGMLLDQKTAELLIRHSVRLYVSLDGATAEVFESIRLGADFARVCRNLQRFSELAANAAYPLSGINIAIQKKNYLQVRQIVDLAHTLQVRRVSFSIVQDPAGERAPLSDEMIREIEQSINLARDYGMLVPFFPTRLRDRLWQNSRYTPIAGAAVETCCDVPAFFATIKPNGDVWACCRSVARIGNILDRSLSDIWRSYRARTVRKMVNSSSFSLLPACADCVYANRYEGPG